MVKTKYRPEKWNARDRVKNQVDDLISITRKWTRRLFADTAAIKHIRDVVQKLPKQRQRQLLSKFTSMARLKTFRDVADFSRPTLKSLPSEYGKHIYDRVDPQSDVDNQMPSDAVCIIWQRFPNCRHEIAQTSQLTFPKEFDELERAEVLRLAITGKTQYKTEVELALRKTPKLHIPNSLKTDMKELDNRDN